MEFIAVAVQMAQVLNVRSIMMDLDLQGNSNLIECVETKKGRNASG